MAEAQLMDRIQWHEGMLLSPQHFQQESARVDALVGWQVLAAQPLAWGVRRLQVDEALLTNGMLSIGVLEAILPNGMAVRYHAAEAQGASLTLDLAAYRSQLDQGDHEPLAVYLVVGSARSLRLPGQPRMFRPVASLLVEDEVSEALAEEVPRMTASLALMAGKPPGAAYVALQLLALQRENETVRRAPFWPAQLEVPADSDILQRARALAGQMRSKAVFLGQQAVPGASRLEDRLALLELRSRLACLTVNLPLLEAVVQAPPVQPWPLYQALCAQLGPLAGLRGDAVPPAPTPYVHGNSYAAFAGVLDRLHALVEEVSQEWKTEIFRWQDGVFALPMRPEWLDGRLVVGVRGQSERDLVRWIEGAQIGSRTVAASLAARRIPGADRQPIEAAPELGLRGGGGWTLFAIEVTAQFIVSDQDLLISNIHDSQQTSLPQQIVLFTRGAA